MNANFAMLLAEMQADFLDELPERCARLEAGVLALERREANAFDELYRQVHSLKGLGGTFALPIVTTICHQFETFISQTDAAFDSRKSGIALQYVDLLRKTIDPGGREPQGLAKIEQVLERLRSSNVGGRVSVLIVEGSATMRKFYQEVFSGQSTVHLAVLDTGLSALERLLHEPFDLLIASREMADLNALALTAAVRESGSSNRDIPVIVVSSSPKPIPEYLRIRAKVRRDPKLAQHLLDLVHSVKLRPKG